MRNIDGGSLMQSRGEMRDEDKLRNIVTYMASRFLNLDFLIILRMILDIR